MKQKLLNKFWLRVGMIVAVMTTALAGTAWAESYSQTYDKSAIQNLSLSGSYALESQYIKVPQTSGNTASFTIPIDSDKQPTSDITVTFHIATYGSGTNPSSSNTTITAVGTETSSNWSGSGVSSYPSSSTYVNGVMTITKPDNPTTLGGLTITMGVNTGVKIFRLQSLTVAYTYETGGSTAPSISADDVDVAYNATSGSISYTLTNEVTGGSMTAATTSDWLTVGTVANGSVPFTCSTNTTKVARTATVTLTYTYNTSETVTKNVIVTQAGNPNIVDNISDITAAGTYTVQGTIVAKSQRGFIVGDGTGYVYYYNQNYTQADYSIGDKVKLAGSVVVYGGVYEFNNSTTVTAATESNYVEEEPTVLSGSDMDTRVASTTPAQISSYVQYEGTLSVSGTYYNITNISGASTAQGSISFPISTDFTSLSGKTVKVTGYYVGISSSKYYNTLIGTIEEVTNAAPVIDASNVTLEHDATSGEIAYTIANPVSGVTLSATTNADWISNITVGASSVTFTTTANEGNADRTATITLSYTGAEDKVVTVTQGHYVADFATLPFEFDGGVADIATTDGLTQSGLGSDYSSSPKLRFDSSDDFIILKFDERPGTLTFDIKGNPGGNPSYWGGTFKVQASEDGTAYSDVATYEDLNNAIETKTINDLGEDVRFIKWIYEEKESGNVALGNIKLAKYTEPVPTITVTPATANPAAADVEGTLALSYENLDISDMTDFGIQFCDAEGEDVADSDWLEVLVAEAEGGEGYVVSYTMEANTGAARTAYFKVFATGDEDFVYSNLVTITQAAYVAPTPGSGNYVRITSLDQLTDESKVIIAARYDETDVTAYFAMPNTTSGKPTGVDFTSETSGGNEILPATISASEDDYYWTVNVTNDGYTFTNADNQMIGYTSSTNFATGGNNTAWTITRETAAESAMVGEYTGFVIRNGNTNTRAFAFNGEAFGAYATSNMTAGGYNFFLDIFMMVEAEPEPYAPETRTLNADGYATFASTSAVDFDNTTGCTAWAVTAVSGTDITFSQITGTIAAGTGVLLKGEPKATVTFSYSTSAGSAVAGNLLVGITEETYVMNEVYFGLKGAKFVKVAAGNVPAGRALLPAEYVTGTGDGVKTLTFNFDEDATAIKAIDNGQLTTDGVIYNVAGQRLSKMQKGINIVNGKKILK